MRSSTMGSHLFFFVEGELESESESESESEKELEEEEDGSLHRVPLQFSQELSPHLCSLFSRLKGLRGAGSFFWKFEKVEKSCEGLEHLIMILQHLRMILQWFVDWSISP